MVPKLVRFGRWMLGDPHMARLGRVMPLYWGVLYLNIAQLLVMIINPYDVRANFWFGITNTIGTIALFLMLFARICADYQDREKKAPQAD